MKKTIITTIVLFCGILVASAQMKINNAGKASFGGSPFINNAYVSMGDSLEYVYSSGYSFGLHTYNLSYQNYGIGIKGYANSQYNGGRSIGVLGVADGINSSTLFGVIGGLDNSNANGAGIFGTLSNHTGASITGRYAGYFDGDVKISGTAVIANLLTPSDSRVKEGVTRIDDSDGYGTTLQNVLNMNVYKYHYSDIIDNSNIRDSADVVTEQIDKKLHYGLLAQELQSLYPELVTETQEGYLALNYVELVPILIQSIQELKEELDEVKGVNGNENKMPRASGINTSIPASKNKLYQNTPNPFKEKTVIRFQLAENVKSADVCIFDMSGKLLKKINVSSGMESVSVNGYELGEGMFLYSLVVNGQETDTKRMIITK